MVVLSFVLTCQAGHCSAVVDLSISSDVKSSVEQAAKNKELLQQRKSELDRQLRAKIDLKVDEPNRVFLDVEVRTEICYFFSGLCCILFAPHIMNGLGGP